MRLRSPHDREILRLALPALGALAAEPLYVLVDTGIASVVWRRRPGATPVSTDEALAGARSATQAPAEPFVLTPHSPASRSDDGRTRRGAEPTAEAAETAEDTTVGHA